MSGIRQGWYAEVSRFSKFDFEIRFPTGRAGEVVTLTAPPGGSKTPRYPLWIDFEMTWDTFVSWFISKSRNDLGYVCILFLFNC
jgi:hypothetical protein